MKDRAAEHRLSRLPVTETHAGTVVYSPGGTYGPRVQQDLQLVLLHTGSATIEIDGRRHLLQGGGVALLKPGCQEHFAFSEIGETWHRWIAVTIEREDPAELQSLEGLPFSIPISDQMNTITDMLLTLMNSGSTPADELIKSLGRSAILLYATECERRQTNISKHPAVLQAKDIIHHDYADDLCLEDLAKRVYKTPEHFIRLFRRDEGVTPIQYLWQYRVKQGLALLRNTGLSIGEVADQVGFKTSYHFARTIKRHTGKTPTEYRIASSPVSFTNYRK
ncbi:AraC family transcriptional regulator [Paenibacillus aurantius]|uniref:AraC family transcriptional regulator n=1 Tax=Paenibacillus aurantius TaxID=2918900 RepID=A0AA96RHF6_9BACL|nr:AraC family transcriptional regulator [Paenibacillus aurantius]WNQ13977.1 AraC family transcriptional regulator [Paenibacillus aurantius]